MSPLNASLSPWHTHFSTQARYHVWATHRLPDARSRVSDENDKRDVGLFFNSIHGTLNALLGQPAPELDWVDHLQLEAAEAKTSSATP